MSTATAQATAQATVTLNADKGGIEIKFPAKPTAAIRQELKMRGFKWSQRQGIWYVKQTPVHLEFANALTVVVNATPDRSYE